MGPLFFYVGGDMASENELEENAAGTPEKILTERSPSHRLFVHGLVLPCKIGVHRHERDAPQRVRISVDLDIRDSNIPRQDTIQEAVNYDDVVGSVRDIVGRDHVNLVESLAEQIITYCLEDERVNAVKVKVEKLDVFGAEAVVGVELYRGRTI